MTATLSTIPDVKAALISFLSDALPMVQVTWGRPQPDQLKRESIFIGDVDVQERTVIMRAGRKVREEHYGVDVVVTVLNSRGLMQEAELRAFELLGALEDIVADDPRLGAVDGLLAATMGHVVPLSGYAKEGPVAVIIATVDCSARLH